MERSLAVCDDPLLYTLLYDYLLVDGHLEAALKQRQEQGLEQVQGQGHNCRRERGRGRGRIDAFLALKPCPQAEEYLRGTDLCLLHRHVRLI